MNKSVIITQQWDYYSKTDDFLTNEELIRDCAEKGVTSFQSYLYWSSVEKEEGIFDFDFYLNLVKILRKHKLKWTPFIILGPYYSIPKWFLDSDKSVVFKCLEHGQNSKIQSLWNPHLLEKVNLFLKKISETFLHNDIESVLLGISGNWGESLYPVEGGFLRTEKDYHTHFGAWCGDDYAKKSFKKFVQARHGNITTLNNAWGTFYTDFSDIEFPVFNSIPAFSFPLRVYRYFACMLNQKFSFVKFPLLSENLSKRKKRKDFCSLKRERDLFDWYIGSMTKYSENWLKMCREYFPDNEIYLVTGGNGSRKMGADFSEQMKIAAKYNAGIRITNQNDSYSDSFVLTLWTASAAKQYLSYFVTEEAWYNSPNGVGMRIFDAESSYARGIYYKTLIDCKLSPSWELFPVSTGGGGEVLKKNLRYYKRELPLITAAILLSNTSIRSSDSYIMNVYHSAKCLRKFIPFDFICENMINVDRLNCYKYLVITDNCIIEERSVEKIKSWQDNGGKILIVNKAKMLTETNKPVKLVSIMFGNNWKKNGKKIAKFLYSDIISGDLLEGKVYYSLFEKKILLFNANGNQEIEFSIFNKKHKICLSDYEIAELRWD